MGRLASRLRRSSLLLSVVMGGTGAGLCLDCNRNGTADQDDLSAGTSHDCNENGVPDECDVLPSYAMNQPQTWPVGSQAFDIAAGDLDDDGKVDLAITGLASGAVSVLYNLGTKANGSLQGFQRKDLPAGEGPRDVIAVSVDADTDFDLVVSRGSGGVAILRNLGGRNFAAPVVHETGLNSFDPRAADLDGDGNLDLAVANRESNNFSVLKGDGVGGFGVAKNYPTRQLPDALDIADLDKDGDSDIAISSEAEDNATVYRNDGKAAFVPSTSLTAGDEPFDLRLGDLDGDSWPDLLVANQLSDTVSIFRNRGSNAGSWLGFQAAGTLPVAQGPVSLDLEDMDGDGILDMAVASMGVNVLGVHRGNGDLSFQPPVTAQAFNCPRGVVATDLDGDARLDLASANVCSNDVTTVLQRPIPLSQDINGNSVPDDCEPDCNRNGLPDDADVARGTSADCNENIVPDECEIQSIVSFAPQKVQEVRAQPESVVAADWNKDGFMDLAVANFNDDTILVLKNDGTGKLPTKTTMVTKDGPTSLTAADFNEDGYSDFAVALQLNHQVGIFRNKADGSGTFLAPLRLTSGQEPVFVATADVDQDGHEDVAAAAFSSAQANVFRGRGDGTFGASSNLATGDGPASIAFGDIDSDGDADMAVPAGFTSFCSLFRNKGGSGAAWLGYELLPAQRVGPSPVSAAFVDLEGDGDLDLVTADSRQAPGVPGESGISISRNGGGGLFASREPMTFGTEPVYVATADVDSDGDPDLIVANQRSNDLVLLLNDGRGGLASSRLQVGEGPYTVCLADFNGDAKPDIVVPNRFGNTISMLLNRSTQQTQTDCNQNLVPDVCDYTTGVLHDEDEDGVADECGRRFHRGDSNNDAMIDISDGIFTLTHLFSGGEAPSCYEAADVNNSADLDISDGIFTFSYLFTGGPAPPAPGPTESPCGRDSDPSGSAGDRGCDRYDGCGA